MILNLQINVLHTIDFLQSNRSILVYVHLKILCRLINIVMLLQIIFNKIKTNLFSS